MKTLRGLREGELGRMEEWRNGKLLGGSMVMYNKWTNYGQLRTADCRLPTADCRLPTEYDLDKNRIIEGIISTNVIGT